MEEAEGLCDRIGVFVDGRLRCIGEPSSLTRRYGGMFLLKVECPAARTHTHTHTLTHTNVLAQVWCPLAVATTHLSMR